MANGTIIGAENIGCIIGYALNTKIIDCRTRGKVEGTTNVGGICGTFYSVIDNLLNQNINLADVVGNKNVGGIVGNIYTSTRSTNMSSVVEYCINAGTIKCETQNAGGIVGFAEGCKYRYSYENYYHYVYVKNSFNVGSIASSDYVGGVIGNPYEFVKSQYSYSIGGVIANSNFGGCFGTTPDSVTFCYYLDDAVTNPTCTAGTAKSEDQLRKKGTYEQWNFDTVWTMEGREDYIYPELRDVPLVFPEDTSHKHEYTSEITAPATHLADGVMTYTCECGDTYTEVIEKTAEHTYTSEITTPATHLTDGAKTFTCECGDTYTEVINKIADHSYEAVVTAPTCIAKGYTTYTCECGDTYVDDYVDAKDHSFEAIVSAPTCIKYGFTTFVCICGENYVSDYVNAKGHIDNNGDYKCDYNCGYEFTKPADPTPDTSSDLSENCDCNCHKGGIAGFFFKILNFFQKLFGQNKVCACGAKH